MNNFKSPKSSYYNTSHKYVSIDLHFDRNYCLILASFSGSWKFAFFWGKYKTIMAIKMWFIIFIYFYSQQILSQYYVLYQENTLSLRFQTARNNSHRTASRQMTKWAKPPCDLVHMIQAEDWYYFKFDYRKYISRTN